MGELNVVGGRMDFKKMTLDLQKSKPDMYAFCKAQAWLRLMKDGMIPVKWYKANKNGTGVKFEMATSQEQMDMEQSKFTTYIDQINDEYDLELEVTITK